MKRGWLSSRGWPIAFLWVVIILISQLMVMAVPAAATQASPAPSSSSVVVASATAPSGPASPEPSLTPADTAEAVPDPPSSPAPIPAPNDPPGVQPTPPGSDTTPTPTLDPSEQSSPSATPSAANPSAEVSVAAVETGALSGVVTTEAGTPIENVTVELRTWDDSISTVTDAQGAYLFATVAVNSYVVSFDPTKDSGLLAEYFDNANSFWDAT